MTGLIGSLKYFSQCKPADLIRVGVGSGSEFGFAVSGTSSGEVDRIIQLASDKLDVCKIEPNVAVISHGKNYQIHESMDNDSIQLKGLYLHGVLTYSIERKDEITLVLNTTDNGRAVFYDMVSGRTISQPAGTGYHLTKWSVLIDIPGLPEPFVVYQST